MRAVECTVPDCQHIHAASHEALVERVLRHYHAAHPEMQLTEQAAEELVDESGYFDKKHAQQGFADHIAEAVSKVPY